VVTDSKKAIVALKWTVREMEDRYRRMAKIGVRGIAAYNERAKEAIDKGEHFERTVQTGFDEAGRPIFESEKIRPEHMLQQAYFAVVYAKEVLKRPDPVVGLINIGTEEGKGRELDQEVFQLFKTAGLFKFYGNVEPKEVLNPPCDILISDGFTANIVMKTMEGTAKGMGTILKRELKSTLLGKIGALFASKNLKNFKKAMSAEEVGGAMIFGLYAPVIKAQGASHAYGFYNGIRQAADVVRAQVYPKVAAYVKEAGVALGNEE